MIKIENIDVNGWEAAIRGMRNPMNSWDRSDSYFSTDTGTEEPDRWYIGKEDEKLMTKLAKAGSVHAKYRRFINVTMDITAPLYWWKEFDTYKVGTVSNSTSTMHKIHSKPFEISDFSTDHLYVKDVRGNCHYILPIDLMDNIIKVLNDYRESYLETKDKEDWWQMIQLLPSSYNQRRTVQLNYEVLSKMYDDRKDHKLDEWRNFIKYVIDMLPLSDELIENNSHL